MHPDSVEEEGRARSEAKLHRSTNILGRLRVLKIRVTDIYISDQKAVSDSLFLIFANLVYTSASHLSDEQVSSIICDMMTSLHSISPCSGPPRSWCP